MENSREMNVFMAGIAEQVGNYNDMVLFVNGILRYTLGLSPEERNLFSNAYKNVIGSLRAMRRTIYYIENMTEAQQVSEKVSATRSYRLKIESELKAKCEEVISLLTNVIIPKTDNNYERVFYFKMIADHSRYIAEFTQNDLRHFYVEKAMTNYNIAADIMSKENLQPIDNLYLELALNRSIFYYEILNNPRTAKDIINTAVIDANHETTILDKDSVDILQLLKDQLIQLNCDNAEPSDE